MSSRHSVSKLTDSEGDGHSFGSDSVSILAGTSVPTHQFQFDEPSTGLGEPSHGLLNDGGLSYLSVPLSSADLHASGAASDSPTESTPSAHPRLLSLDCFRGLVIAWMIMADETGPAWTHALDHAPWNGLHFADFVFPAFVFIVGLAVPMSTRKFTDDRWGATKKAIWRAIKMFIVGFISASGGFPQDNQPSTYRLASIRIPGILQRIAFAYLVVVLVHVWVPVRDQFSPSRLGYGRNYLALYRKYMWQWLCALVLVIIYLAMTFGTNVPGCGYGHLDPDCNATGYWDRTILGLSHMYVHPTLVRSAPCSYNSPGFDPIPDRPSWCNRPYDPEGIVGSFTACVTGLFGLFFGHVLSNESKHSARLRTWLSLAAVCMVGGLTLHFSGAIPINKNLWSISYVLVMAAVDGVVFSIFYWVVDMRGYRRAIFPLIAMGMNAILVFVVAQSDISVDTFMQWFYINDPTENLYHWYQTTVLTNNLGESWGIFLWGCSKVAAWLAISVVLHRNKIFWKL